MAIGMLPFCTRWVWFLCKFEYLDGPFVSRKKSLIWILYCLDVDIIVRFWGVYGGNANKLEKGCEQFVEALLNEKTKIAATCWTPVVNGRSCSSTPLSNAENGNIDNHHLGVKALHGKMETRFKMNVSFRCWCCWRQGGKIAAELSCHASTTCYQATADGHEADQDHNIYVPHTRTKSKSETMQWLLRFISVR